MLDDKDKSVIQEKIVKLYLRLNGFLTESYIAHSAIHGQNLSEVDVIGVRFPFHSESERRVGACPRLQIDDQKTHIIIGEVKSHGQPLRFNESIRNNQEIVQKILLRMGFIEPIEVRNNLESIYALFQNESSTPESINRFEIPNSNYVVSAMIFKPETTNQRNTQNYFFTESNIFSYLWECFRPEEVRCGCATTYDYSTWGQYEELVRFFKSPERTSHGGMRDLYAFVEQIRAPELVEEI